MTEQTTPRVFPFIEHEFGDITGSGHQDREAFAENVNRYELATTGTSNGWTADDIEHAWTRGDDGEERPELCAEGTPGAQPITILWGRR
jgi:hypothetical protein